VTGNRRARHSSAPELSDAGGEFSRRLIVGVCGHLPADRPADLMVPVPEKVCCRVHLTYPSTPISARIIPVTEQVGQVV
jgi:hypothetical protein